MLLILTSNSLLINTNSQDREIHFCTTKFKIHFWRNDVCKELLLQDFTMVDGKLPVPTKPGLGIELNRDALQKFKEAAHKVAMLRRW